VMAAIERRGEGRALKIRNLTKKNEAIDWMNASELLQTGVALGAVRPKD